MKIYLAIRIKFCLDAAVREQQRRSVFELFDRVKEEEKEDKEEEKVLGIVGVSSDSCRPTSRVVPQRNPRSPNPSVFRKQYCDSRIDINNLAPQPTRQRDIAAAATATAAVRVVFEV